MLRTKNMYCYHILQLGLSMELAEDLYKRDAGSIDQHKTPKNFTYKQFLYHQYDSDAFEAVYKHTNGPFVWVHQRIGKVIGFKYPSDMTMFLLGFKENRP